MSKTTEFTNLAQEFIERLDAEMDKNKAYIILTVDKTEDSHQLLISAGGREWLKVAMLAEFTKSPQTKHLIDKAISSVIEERLEEMALAKEDEKEDLNQLLTILKNKN